MKLSYTTLSVQEKTLAQAVEIASRYGLDGIELRGKDDIHLSPDSSPVYRREARSRIRDAGLEIPCITAYARFAQPTAALAREQAKTLRGYVELCMEMNAKTIRAFVGPRPEGMKEQDGRQIIREGLCEAAEVMEDSGVKLILETHDSAKSGAQMAPLLQGVDERVGVLLDLVHPYDMGEDIQTTWALIGPRIAHVHVKDLYETLEGGRRYSPIGAGVMNVAKSVGYLTQQGYRGFFSLEWEKSAPGSDGVSFEDQMQSFVRMMRTDAGFKASEA